MGLLGFFKGKDDNGQPGGEGQEEAQPVEEAPAVPEEQPVGETGPSEGDRGENKYEKKAEDIISQLAHLNSILEDDDNGSESLSDIVEPGLAPPPSAPPPSAPPPSAPPPSAPVTQPPVAQGDTISLAAEDILPSVPPEILTDTIENLNSMYSGNPEYTFTFRRLNVMKGLSKGKIELTVQEFMASIDAPIVDEAAALSGGSVILPLDRIVRHVPPDWFHRKEQDKGREKIVEDMDDLFDIDIAAATGTDSSSEEVVPAKEDVTDQESASPAAAPAEDASEPIITHEQKDEPPAEPRKPYKQRVAATVDGDNVQVDPVLALGPVADDLLLLPKGEILDQVGAELTFTLTKDEVVKGLEAEQLVMPLKDYFRRFSFELFTEDGGSSLEQVTLSLKAIKECLPEDWLPVAEEPVAEEPVAEEPVAEEPVAEEPVAEEPVATPIEDFVTPAALSGAVPKVTVPPPVSQQVIEDADTDTQTIELHAEKKVRAEMPLDKLKGVGRDVFSPEEPLTQPAIFDEEMPAEVDEPLWESQAPNGISINRAGPDQFCELSSVGPATAQLIVDFRRENGPFKHLSDLLSVPGLGRKTYRDMTGISSRSSLMKAEQRLNTTLGVETDKVSLLRIAEAAMKRFELQACYVGSTDGLILAQAAKSDAIAAFGEPFLAVAPQLFKRTGKALSQACLPEAEMVSFFLGKHAVTFSGSGKVFCVMVHGTDYPHPKVLKSCRKFIGELVWYCSPRAVL